jgi:hypothetical protein
MAEAIAKGKVKAHRVDEKPIRYTLKEREHWARVAGYIAQTMAVIAKNFDEHEVDLMLAEAHRLVREAEQMAANKRSKGPVGETKAASS